MLNVTVLIKWIFTFTILLTSISFSYAQTELACSKLHQIQIQYLTKHIQYSSFSNALKKRTVERLITSLDGNKIYFLKNDVHQIKKWLKNIFLDLKNKNCTPLIKLYNLFSQRTSERYKFVRKYLSRKNLKINNDVVINLNSDKRDFFSRRASLDNFHKKYIQYELASIMIVEKDLKSSKKQLQEIYNRLEKKITGWNPNPSAERAQYCSDQDSKFRTIKTCKYEEWYARYLDSFARALDPHSGYLSQYQMDDFEINMKLSLDGIGASLSSRYGYTTIEKLLEGGVAKNSKKLKNKDKILAIGQKRNQMFSIFGWDLRDVVEIIRGKKGTPVYLKVLRELKSGKSKKFIVKLLRDRIQLTESAARIFYSKATINNTEKRIAVINVPSFYGGSRSSATHRSVSDDIKKLIDQAKKKQTQSIVLDLSGNGGGILHEAVEVAGLFLEKGNIVRQGARDYNGRTIYYDLSDKDGVISFKGPLVVLIDRSSASASEIVAGALRDYRRAVIVGGDHTFGKGSVQSVENVSPRLGATKATVGLYFTPSGRSTQKVGVYSDIPFPSRLSVDKFGEKNLDYVLPAQHTTAFFSTPFNRKWKKITLNMLKKLNTRSQNRIKKSEKFAKVQKDIEKYKKRNDSIKLETLIAELKDNDKKSDADKEDDDSEELSYKDPKFKKKYLERADISEAINVAQDLLALQQSQNFLVKKKDL